jgi:hypothetical protein
MAGEVGDTGAGRGGSPGAGGSKGRGGQRRGGAGNNARKAGGVKRENWKYKKDQTHFVEGQEPELRYKNEKREDYGNKIRNLLYNTLPGSQTDTGESVTPLLAKSRNKANKAQQKEWNKAFALRKKIKPITDPDGDKSEARKKAVRRKGRGRVGTTTLSQSQDTLG